MNRPLTFIVPKYYEKQRLNNPAVTSAVAQIRRFYWLFTQEPNEHVMLKVNTLFCNSDEFRNNLFYKLWNSLRKDAIRTGRLMSSLWYCFYQKRAHFYCLKVAF